MNAQDVKRFIEHRGELATLPALFRKILAITADEDSSEQDLHDLIAADQVLAERVLRMGNSVLFCHSGQIRDIHQAILFLGFDRIKAIALGMSVMQLLPTGGSFNVQNLWIHAYEVAFLASSLSETTGMVNPAECFLAALLHDIGRLVFYMMDRTRFLKIETTDTMLEQEQAAFGCTHAEAGAWYAENVRIPQDIAASIGCHHHPSAAMENRELVCAVSLAEALSRRFSPRVEDDGIWTREHDAILLEFSLSNADLSRLGERFKAAEQEIAYLFHA